jgi:hypothetical protein
VNLFPSSTSLEKNSNGQPCLAFTLILLPPQGEFYGIEVLMYLTTSAGGWVENLHCYLRKMTLMGAARQWHVSNLGMGDARAR